MSFILTFFFSLACLLVNGAEAEEVVSPWPSQTPPRASEPSKCENRDDLYLDSMARLHRLQQEQAVDGSTTALDEQIVAARERIAFANSSSFTCAVGCYLVNATACGKCPTVYSYAACSNFGGCDPVLTSSFVNGNSNSWTTSSQRDDDITCTCLDGFVGRRCASKAMSAGGVVCLVLVNLVAFVVFYFYGGAAREGMSYNGDLAGPSKTKPSLDQVRQIVTQFIVMLQLQEPAFKTDEHMAVDYGLPEWPSWLGFVSLDFSSFVWQYVALMTAVVVLNIGWNKWGILGAGNAKATNRAQMVSDMQATQDAQQLAQLLGQLQDENAQLRTSLAKATQEKQGTSRRRHL